MESKVAVVTGAVSGIGLALTQDLLSQGWRIAMGDVNDAAGKELVAKLGPNVLFCKTDVSDWDQLAVLFKTAHTKWGRIDFHAANAGVGDIEAMYGPTASEDGEPRKPNLRTVDIDLSAVIYGVRLSMHYFRRNPVPGGKIVVTSSVAGLYPAPHLPQYSACKHALVGLTRAMAVPLSGENTTINAICPAFVLTALAPAALKDAWPKEHTTPMSTILKAYRQFIDTELSGQIAECSLAEVYLRDPPAYANDSQKWLVEDSASVWEKADPLRR